MVCRVLSFQECAQAAAGIRVGLSDTKIGELIDRDGRVVRAAEEFARLRGVEAVSADCRAQRRRHRPQARFDRDP